MKRLSLSSKTKRQAIDLPVAFVDAYLPEAPETALKVYLYLLRSAMDPSIILSLSDMADLFDVTPNKIMIALGYWEARNLIALSYDGDELADIVLLPVPEAQETPVRPQKEEAAELKVPLQAESGMKTQDAPLPFDTDALLRDEAFLNLLSLAEYYMKKPLSSAMRDALAFSYLQLDKRADFTEYLIEYCIENKHTNPNYLRTVASGWAADGFRSVDELKKSNADRNKDVYGIMNALGLKNREPAGIELDFIRQWTTDFDLPVIIEACNRTISAVHQPDFRYVNAILERWKYASVREVSDIDRLDSAHRERKKDAPQKGAQKGNAFRNFDERNTDYDALFSDKKEG